MELVHPNKWTPPLEKAAQITVTPHNKSEWLRFSKAAHIAGYVALGDFFAAAADVPSGQRIRCAHFDMLQHAYREWLISNRFIEVQPY